MASDANEGVPDTKENGRTTWPMLREAKRRPMEDSFPYCFLALRFRNTNEASTRAMTPKGAAMIKRIRDS